MSSTILKKNVGLTFKKVYRARFEDWKSKRQLSVTRLCQWLKISRQDYYQSEKRAQVEALRLEMYSKGALTNIQEWQNC
ncbi:hypothetical protein KTH91_03110 [Acinetobacter bereziniae]|nr:hypothetical protein [Acinetobacter bereziniae]